MTKLIKTLLVLCLIIFGNVGRMSVKADESEPLGSITIRPTYDKQTVSGGNLAIYQVAGLDTNQTYRLQSPFDRVSLSVTAENLVEHNRDYAQALAQYVSSATPVSTVDTISANGVTVSDLPAGLYLFVQTEATDGYELLTPFLISIPYNGSYTVEATEKMSLVKTKPKTVYPDTGKKRDKELPFTGQLWWPVPVLIGSGVLCLGLSFVGRRRT